MEIIGLYKVEYSLFEMSQFQTSPNFGIFVQIQVEHPSPENLKSQCQYDAQNVSDLGAFLD
jgi:hypothetical protein